MNLRQMTIFSAVCECGSMTAAAKKLFMTQPAISQTISDFEAELGVHLFERINKKLLLTYPGEVLLTYCKRVLTLVDEAEHTIENIVNLHSGKLRIGASTTIGIYLLPALIGTFHKSNKNIDIPFMIDNTRVVTEKILENQIDIGLVEGPVLSNDIQMEHYFEDELYLICSHQHSWASRTSIDPEELLHEDLMLREKGSGTRDVFEKTMSQHNYSCSVKHVLNNTEAIKKAVEANIGVSILSKLALTEELSTNKLKRVKIKGISFKRPLHIIFHKDKYRSAVFQAFVQFLHKESIS